MNACGARPHRVGAWVERLLVSVALLVCARAEAQQTLTPETRELAPAPRKTCADSDMDGCDDCSSGMFSIAADGIDTDQDGACDVGDPDDDNDGVPDGSDVAPLDPLRCRDVDGDMCDDCARVGREGKGGDPRNDGIDSDGDGTCDFHESDFDGDGVPDPIDPDADGDGILNNADGFDDRDGDGKRNYLDRDSDADGLLDAIEWTVDSDHDGTPDFLDADSDGDDVPDRIEADDEHGDGYSDHATVGDRNGDGIDDKFAVQLPKIDHDGDGIADELDVDDDGDGVSTLRERGSRRIDSDQDGIPDHLDDDDDGDGVRTAVELGASPELPGDTDGDGIPDYLDLDSDGDGYLDANEGEEDRDHDGVPDYLEPSEVGLSGGGVGCTLTSGQSGVDLPGWLLALAWLHHRRRKARQVAKTRRAAFALHHELILSLWWRARPAPCAFASRDGPLHSWEGPLRSGYADSMTAYDLTVTCERAVALALLRRY